LLALIDVASLSIRTDCRRTSIDLDAVLANLALEEGDERLPQTLKLWIRSD